jgi:hypothetical protein
MKAENFINYKLESSQRNNIYFGTVFAIFVYAFDFLIESLKDPQLKYILNFVPTFSIILLSGYFVLIKKPRKAYFNSFVRDPINLLCLASLIFGILWNLIYRADIPAILQTGVFWGSILSYKLFTEKFFISRYTFFWVLLLLIIPYILTSNDPELLKALIPHAENQWRAFLISVHFSSVLGSLILVFGIYGISKIENLIINFSMVSAGLYLVIFAKSRTSLLATIISLLLVMFFTNKKQVALFLVTLLSVVSIYFFVPLIQDHPNLISGFANTSFVKSFIRLDATDEVYGISSGRQWLWSYHIELFQKNILTGASRQLTAFKIGDKIGKERALAASESFFTYVLARYGIWGISYYVFFLLLLWKSIKSNNKEFYLLMVYSISSCVGISLLGNTYGAHNIVIYLYIFTLLNTSNQARISHSPRLLIG